jgi:hypothetical protein
MTRTHTIVVVALLGFFSVGFAQTQKVDISGVWSVVFHPPMGETTYSTSFVPEKESLKVVMESPSGSVLKGSGKIKGNALEWTVVVSGPMGEIPLTFKGKVEGQSMAGRVQMGDAGDSEFTARKVK